MTRSWVGKVAAALVAAFALGGCYTYQPVRLADVRPDSRVRVTVSAVRAVELEPALRGIRPQFNATYLGGDNGSLLFAVPLFGATTSGSRSVHNRIDIPTADIVAVESREFSKWRTAAVAGVLVAAVGWGGYEVFNSGNDQDDRNKPPDVEQIRVPLLRIPLGR